MIWTLDGQESLNERKIGFVTNGNNWIKPVGPIQTRPFFKIQQVLVQAPKAMMYCIHLYSQQGFKTNNKKDNIFLNKIEPLEN